VLADDTFEKHYRIGDLARMWGLGRETVQQTRPGRSRRYKNQNGKKESAHRLQHSRIRGAAHSHAPAQRRLTAVASKCTLREDSLCFSN
jgi:hypothetical protein